MSTEPKILGGDIVLLQSLGQGGVSTIFLGRQLSTGMECAVKTLPAGDTSRRAVLLRESRILARVPSDHVPRVLRIGEVEADGGQWFAMELLHGESLGWLADNPGLDATAAIAVILDVCDALDAAHRRGIVHCDVKPDNIIIVRTHERAYSAYVIDFGSAKWQLEAEDPLEGPAGTPLFMAPEQLQSRDLVTPATDVWALGLLAFYLLTGRHYWSAMPRNTGARLDRAGRGETEEPFNKLEDTIDGLEDTFDDDRAALDDASQGHSIAEVFHKILQSPLVRASELARKIGCTAELPDWFDDWFAGCVSRDINQRFATAGQAAQALRSYREALVWKIVFQDADAFSIALAISQLRVLAAEPSLSLLRVERGSITLVLMGSRRGFENVRSLATRGALPSIAGAPVLAIECFDDNRSMVRPPQSSAIDAFISYSPQDMSFCDELLIHLSMMRRQGLINEWHERLLTAGSVADDVVGEWLTRCELFMVLLSADYIASDKCFQRELQAAMAKHQTQAGCLVPIIVRACDWAHPPFSHLSALPRNGIPVSSWRNRDEGWAEVIRDIRPIVQDLHTRRTMRADEAP